MPTPAVQVALDKIKSDVTALEKLLSPAVDPPPVINPPVDPPPVITPPPTGAAVIHPAPSGPPMPADGWKVVAADGFDASHPLSSLWVPNRNSKGGTQPVFNPGTEIAPFNASQVAITDHGVELTAVCKGVKSYLSGAITSQQGPGFAGTGGFSFQPVKGQTIVLEVVMKLPTMPGSDPGFWSYWDGAKNGSWIENDYQETWHYGSDDAMACPAWFGTMIGKQERTLYDNQGKKGPSRDGNWHRWTYEFDGNAQRLNAYLDGKPLVSGNDYHIDNDGKASVPWPSNHPTLTGASWYQALFSYAVRDVGKGVTPSYVPGTSDKWTIRSFAAYVNGNADTSKSIMGGGIAAGTVIA